MIRGSERALYRQLRPSKSWATQRSLAFFWSLNFPWASHNWVLRNYEEVGDVKDPLEAILVIFGRRALIFFCLKGLGKKWKMTPLLCACAVVITLETQKCRKRAPRSVEFNFFINCDRHKRFSQNERRRTDLQNVASDFLILPGDLVMIFQSLVTILPRFFFSTLKDHN